MLVTYVSEDCCDSENILEKTNKKQEADSSSEHPGFITACVTRYSLLHDRLVTNLNSILALL